MNIADRVGRRFLLQAAIAGGAVISIADRASGATTTVNMQLGYLGGGNQIGEVAASAARLFRAGRAGTETATGRPEQRRHRHRRLRPLRGGPGFVQSVADARGIAGHPDQVLCRVRAQHPYAFFSLKKNPVRSAADFRGKRVGIQATGVILLRALMAKNNIDPKDVQIVTIGSEMTPLMTGQVDVVTGWLTKHQRR